MSIVSHPQPANKLPPPIAHEPFGSAYRDYGNMPKPPMYTRLWRWLVERFDFLRGRHDLITPDYPAMPTEDDPLIDQLLGTLCHDEHRNALFAVLGVDLDRLIREIVREEIRKAARK